MEAGTTQNIRQLPARLSNYLLVYRLAAGGMGEIYLAFQRSAISKRLVAIKVQRRTTLDDETMRDMFIDEARASANLQHPNIVHVYEVAEIDGTPYIVMEYIEGSSVGALRRALKNHGGAAPPHIVARLLQETAKALAYAHDAGLIHRDVSPPNILVGDSGTVKLIDFGVAKGEGALQQTVPGLLKGKYAFMAPEYLQGQSATPACDIFSVGVVMHELLTGKRVFSGDSAGVIITAVLSSNVPPIGDLVPNLPPALAEIIDQCCSRNPNERPTARDLVERLERALPAMTPQGAPTLGQWYRELMGEAINARQELRRKLLALDLSNIEAGAAPLLETTESKRVLRVEPVGSIPPSGMRAADPEISGIAGAGMSGANMAGSGSGLSGGANPMPGLLQPPPNIPSPPARSSRLLPIAIALLALAISAMAVILFVRKDHNDGTRVVDSPIPPEAPTESPVRAEAAKHRQEGMQAMAAHDYDRAVDEFETAIKLGANDADIGQLLALAMTLRTQQPKRDKKTPTPPAPPAPEPPRNARIAPAPAPWRPPPARTATPEPPAEVEKKGTLLVTSTPADLACEVDGKSSGTTPLQLSLPVGSHVVRLLKDGAVIHSETANISLNGVAAVHGDWKPPPTEPLPSPPTTVAAVSTTSQPSPKPAPAVAGDYGEILVQSPNVLGHVFIGGVDRGPAPVVVKNLPVGPTTVEIRVGSSVRRSRVVEVAKARRKTIFFE